jgi:hypothetical protein
MHSLPSHRSETLPVTIVASRADFPACFALFVHFPADLGQTALGRLGQLFTALGRSGQVLTAFGRLGQILTALGCLGQVLTCLSRLGQVLTGLGHFRSQCS